jgi:hypothetical protein
LPEDVGVNVTDTVQLEPAATEPAQLLLLLKFAPVMAMLAMVRAEVPALLKIMVCAALVEPIL